MRGEKIVVPYEGTHIRMSVMGRVCLRTGEFSALMFSRGDTQVFLDHANQEIGFQQTRNILICDAAPWHKSKSLN